MNIYDEVKDIREKSSMKIFDLLCKHDNEKLPVEFNAVGITFHTMIGPKNPDEILSVLTHIHLNQEGVELAYTHWTSECFGQYDVVIKFKNSHKEDKDIFKYLKLEDSKMGAWNAYLLHTLWHTLPLNDHSGYSYRKYLFSKKEVDALFIEDQIVKKKCSNSNIDIIIVGLSDYYYVSCCYWCPFSGLSRVVCEIQVRDGKVINISEISHIKLVKYRDLIL